MKLNDEQRKVLQAMLDGKTVKYRFGSNALTELELSDGYAMANIGVREDLTTFISGPPVKVALFGKRDDLTVLTEGEYEDGWADYERVSEWVKITPTFKAPEPPRGVLGGEQKREVWLRHFGGECPVPRGVEVRVHLRGYPEPQYEIREAQNWAWAWHQASADIMSYCVVGS